MIKNLIILILILIFIGIIVLLDLPKFQDILGLKKEIETQKKEFSENQARLDRVEKLAQSYEENKENLKKISYILPPSEDIPNLIVQLEALALEGGLVLENIKFKMPQEEGTSSRAEAERIRQEEGAVSKEYQTLTVNLKLIGTYLAFKNFLKAVEDNIRLIDIVSIGFSPESKEESRILKIDLDINTYYQ